MIRRGLFMVACFAAVLPAGAASNGFTNGSFETNNCSAPTFGYVDLGRGNTCIIGWTIGDGTTDPGSGTVDLVDGGLWQAAAGTFSIDLDGETPGSISQTFSTTPGTTYNVTFGLSGNPLAGPAVKILLVTGPGTSTVYTYNISLVGNTTSNMAYVSEVFSFTASGASSTLTFASEDASSSASGPVIDNVNVSVASVLPLGAFTNGSFDSNSCSVPSGYYVSLGRGNACISSWTVGDGTTDPGSGTVDLVDSGLWQAAAGTLSIDLDGETPGSISQTFSTTPGATYNVTFALSGNPLAAPAVKTLLVTGPGASTVYTYNISQVGNTTSNMLYVNEIFSFTASGASSTLTFASEDASSSASGPVINNVNVSAAGAPPGPVTVFSPTQGATSVSQTTPLIWGAVTGATSYDVYFGTSALPPFVANTIGTSYNPGPLNAGATYYWYLVSKDAFGSTPSAIWSFTTGGSSHPAFFTGEDSLGSGVYYLQFPNGNIFGYYNYQFFPVLYHYDLGFEYFLDANDGKGGAFLYDFASGHWFYTSPSYPFPYLYDFTLRSILYYYPNLSQPGHYTSNPRDFYDFATGKIITM